MTLLRVNWWASSVRTAPAKSTLLRILAGDLVADSGAVERAGLLGSCPQDTVLHQAFTVEQHLQFFQSAYGISSLTRAFELLERLNFSDYRHERVEALSGGTRQKLNLVLALMHDPRVLLLDEPYQGFDWETYLRFWDVAADLRDRGCAVLVVSHLAYDASRLDTLYRLEIAAYCRRQNRPKRGWRRYDAVVVLLPYGRALRADRAGA